MSNKGLLLTDGKTREIARKWFPPSMEETARDYGYHIQGALLAKAHPIIEKQRDKQWVEWYEGKLNEIFRASWKATLTDKQRKELNKLSEETLSDLQTLKGN